MSSNITVVIPTHNRSEFLLRAVNSCIFQTLKPDRIIVVENGSDIETIRANSKIEGITHCVIPHGDVAQARNHGIEICDTEYICFLDDDDMFLPSKLELQQRQIIRTQRDVIGCLHILQVPAEDDSFVITPEHAMETIMMYPSSIIAKTSVCKQVMFNPDIGYLEDYEWLVRLTEKHKVYRTNDRLFHHSEHPQNRTLEFAEQFDDLREKVLKDLMTKTGKPFQKRIVKFLENVPK